MDGDVRPRRVFLKVAKGGPKFRQVREMVRVVTIQVANCIRVVGS